MTRKKREHFEDLHQWPHVFEEGAECAGQWGDRVILELACGVGRYTIALAKRLPEVTLVGVDMKGARMWHGARQAMEEGLKNAQFLRIRIEDLEQYFAVGEVDEIWITFPDPHPRKGKAKKRLSSPRFLNIYREILKPGGLVHFKTDDPPLFDYTVQTAKQEGWTIDRLVPDVYAPEVEDELLHIKTLYEERHLAEGRRISYVSFFFDGTQSR
jgi:tRNA (guanine-N7-)-methyltransferase